MGVGGACIMPGTLSLLVYVFPSRQRPLAIGVWSGVSGIGILLGPILAGWLIERYWWGSVFLVNMPVVVVAFVAGWLLLPESGATVRPHPSTRPARCSPWWPSWVCSTR